MAERPGIMDAQTQARETYLVVINLPGPNWESPLPATPEMTEQHHAIYQALLEEGMLISAGRLDGTPVMGISLFHQGVDEHVIRARLDGDELVKRGYIALEYRHWALLSGSLAGVKGFPEG
jgi:hypothetical protein